MTANQISVLPRVFRYGAIREIMIIETRELFAAFPGGPVGRAARIVSWRNRGDGGRVAQQD